jgi:hypothetical protein
LFRLKEILLKKCSDDLLLGKNLNSVSEIDKIAHSRIPFEVLHYHPDNDKTILRVLFDKVRKNGAMISRSRPYKKNDNAHVEQKGGDKVRKSERV